MNLPAEVLQFLGSLAAILALAWLARAMGLGGSPTLSGAAAAGHAAAEAVDGYQPCETAVDRRGQSAIMRDAAGRILLLKLHGNKFAGRILGPTAAARQVNGSLIVATGERRYGEVRLEVPDPAAWAAAINALGSPRHA